MKKVSLVVATVGLVALTASASLYKDSFESGLSSSWTTIWPSITTEAVSTPAAAVTDGSNALKISHTENAKYIGLLTLDSVNDSSFLAAVTDPNATTISVDFFMDSLTSTALSGWRKAGINFESAAGSSNVEVFFTPNADSSIHVEVDLTGINLDGASWAKATLWMQTKNGNTGAGVSSPIYADNFEVIPEPATLGLLATFSGALLFIRRRFLI